MNPKHILKNLFVATTVLLLLSACGKSGNESEKEKEKENAAEVTKDFDYGKTEGNVYSNKYFGLTLEFPSEWKIQTKEEMQQITEAGKSQLDPNDPVMKQAIKAIDVKTAYLFTIFKYEVGSLVDFNPSFMVLAENTSSVPSVTTGKDYLQSAKRLLKRAAANAEIEDEFESAKIGSKEFYIMKAVLDQGAGPVNQSYYTTIKDGFALSFILTYSNDEQKAELMQIIEKVKMD